jgi:hypothetical protein
MARELDPATESAFVVPGLYQHLMDRARESVRHGDPRITWGVDDPVERARLLVPSPPSRASRRLAKLEVGAPVIVETWHVGGNFFAEARSIPWIGDHSTRWMRVGADDAVAPARVP